MLLATEAVDCSRVAEISSTEAACWLEDWDRLWAVAETSSEAEERLSAAPPHLADDVPQAPQGEVVGGAPHLADDVPQAPHHALHGLQQAADFVVPLGPQMHRQVALGQGVGGPHRLPDRAQHHPAQNEGEQGPAGPR